MKVEMLRMSPFLWAAAVDQRTPRSLLRRAFSLVDVHINRRTGGNIFAIRYNGHWWTSLTPKAVVIYRTISAHVALFLIFKNAKFILLCNTLNRPQVKQQDIKHNGVWNHFLEYMKKKRIIWNSHSLLCALL